MYDCEVCGGPIKLRSDRRVVRYCSRQCCGVAKRGVPLVAHPLYNGGLAFDRESGRWRIMCRDGTQMYYSRGVMAAELGRLLEPHELVHHVDENPSHDSPENLELTDRPAHIEKHREKLRAAKGRR
jgi:hypothetical protein